MHHVKKENWKAVLNNWLAWWRLWRLPWGFLIKNCRMCDFLLLLDSPMTIFKTETRVQFIQLLAYLLDYMAIIVKSRVVNDEKFYWPFVKGTIIKPFDPFSFFFLFFCCCETQHKILFDPFPFCDASRTQTHTRMWYFNIVLYCMFQQQNDALSMDYKWIFTTCFLIYSRTVSN